jgi:hypothetical protein
MADVLIDGALPRSDRERGRALCAYLEINNEDAAREALLLLDDSIAHECYEEWENETLQSIAEAVGTYTDGIFIPGMVMCGAHCPGDVVVYWPGDEDYPEDDDEI